MNLPVLLILFRFLLAPIILYQAYFVGQTSGPIIITMMYAGMISDIMDGIIARKQNKSTEKLRRWDSQVDMLFWLSIGFATWFLYPELIKKHAVPIWILLSMEVFCYLTSLIKFRKETCTHAFLAKIWGITLLIAFTSLIGYGYAGIPFDLAIIMGLISQIDRIFISLFLSKWTHDVPSSYHAWLIRKGKSIKRNPLLND